MAPMGGDCKGWEGGKSTLDGSFKRGNLFSISLKTGAQIEKP